MNIDKNLWNEIASLMESGEYAAVLKIVLPRANKGDADFEHFLGVLYRDGLGVNKDLKVAAQWFTKAANEASELNLVKKQLT